MHLSERTHIQLRPNNGTLRDAELLKAWMAASFEPEACKRALDQWLTRHQYPKSWFDVSAIDVGGLVASEELLFPTVRSDWEWRMVTARRIVCASLPEEAVCDVATVIRALPHVKELPEFLAQCGEAFDAPIQSALSSAFTDARTFGTWPEANEPGIYRREHASLILSSRRTRLVVDPQCLQGSWTTNFGAFPIDHSPSADAVLITHGHGDHWHLPSTLRFCRDDTCVIVPEVPRVNLLCDEDFSSSLSAAKQRHCVLPWNTSIKVGDFEIRALPFLGEQPTRHERIVPDGLRNWGNCYRVQCPSYSALVLADSGGDPLGEMRDVVSDNVKEFGKVDAIFSCCLSFPEMINLGLASYFLTIPFRRLREIHAERKFGKAVSITSGIDGVAELCAVAGAKYFLPYAHGFEGLKKPIEQQNLTHIGSEAQLMTKLEGALVRFGATTSVIRWNPGDYFCIS